MKIQWKEFITKLVVEYCDKKQNDVFSLRDFYIYSKETIEKAFPNNNNIQAKVRQQLQFLNDIMESLPKSARKSVKSIFLIIF